MIVTKAKRQQLREAAIVASHVTRSRRSAAATQDAEWELQTSNSFRRIGTRGDGDGNVLCGTKHPVDGHPDLHAPAGVLDYIVAAQPSVVLELLDALDKIDQDRLFASDNAALHDAIRAYLTDKQQYLEGVDLLYAPGGGLKDEELHKWRRDDNAGLFSDADKFVTQLVEIAESEADSRSTQTHHFLVRTHQLMRGRATYAFVLMRDVAAQVEAR